MSGHYLGFDLGLTGARAAVIDGTGRLVSRGRSRANVGPPPVAAVEGSPLAWRRQVLAAGKQAISEAGDPRIEAIGIGALGPAPVMLDAALEPIGKSPLFSLDSRSEGHRAALLAEHRLPDDAIGLDHVIPKLRWIKENEPQHFDRAAWAVDATGFLVASFTGVPVIDRITACDHVLGGIPRPLPMPSPLAPDAIAGPLTQKAAGLLGLPAGIPVTVGTYDSYVDIAGAGALGMGEACLLLGSTLVLGRVVEEPCSGLGLRSTPHVGEGHFLGGWTSAAGSLLDWSSSLYGPRAVDDAATLEPGSGGLVMLPYLAGERAPVWDARARGALLGATFSTSSAELHRAAIDAVALSALDLSKRLIELTGPLGAYRVSGGGARNAAFAQAVADATGTELEVIADAGEATAPALLAARATGARIAAATHRRVMPDPARHARYLRLLDIYRELYANLRRSMHRLGELTSPRETR